MYGYSVEKARTHIASTVHNPDGWSKRVYVYAIRKTRDNHGDDAGYAIQFEDMFKYSCAIMTPSDKDVLNDALSNARYGSFEKAKRQLHKTTILHSAPYFEFASTEWKASHDVAFAPGQHIGGTTFNYRNILLIATIGPELHPQFVTEAIAYADNMFANSDNCDEYI